ncbi:MULTISPECIES: alpha/beta hydrolase [Kocuria]|uniref:alpha/beta hydrolase n=1 Tax=Kocuria TaxID=57493 RepID=UPI000738D817|nr:alpha/beta hydrolase fold domain-containing protein [Kocuria palustris]KUG54862.1 hypothetical protein AVL60_00425 [Kocuria palustris]
MSSITHRPPFDAETEASMNAIAEQLPVITPEMIASLREVPLPVSFSEELLAEHDAVAVSVEYRLAPEFPDPCPVEDCHAGLVWTAANAAQLGIDPQRLMIAGASASAGGGLAAAHLSAPARDDPRVVARCTRTSRRARRTRASTAGAGDVACGFPPPASAGPRQGDRSGRQGLPRACPRDAGHARRPAPKSAVSAPRTAL